MFKTGIPKQQNLHDLILGFRGAPCADTTSVQIKKDQNLNPNVPCPNGEELPWQTKEILRRNFSEKKALPAGAAHAVSHEKMQETATSSLHRIERDLRCHRICRTQSSLQTHMYASSPVASSNLRTDKARTMRALPWKKKVLSLLLPAI